ncbi:MAG: TerB family tellurite resistance protein [Candidatus Thiodiazotropha sp.]
MFNKLQNFFNTYLSPDHAGGTDDTAQRMRLAVAALLFEIAFSDFDSVKSERQMILQIVAKAFMLSPEEAETLLTLAESEHQASTDYFQFTRLINQHYTAQQKVDLVESLWHVAFADGELHRYEEHVIRRLADLLYVSHTDFIAAKHRALAVVNSG